MLFFASPDRPRVEPSIDYPPSKTVDIVDDYHGALPPFMPVRRILEEPLIVNGAGNKAERERRLPTSQRESPRVIDFTIQIHGIDAPAVIPDSCPCAENG